MMGLWRSNDLALARDPSSRFLTGLLAVMVFLAALAAIGALSARSFAGDWSAALTDRVTVQVPPLIGEVSEGTTTPGLNERRDAVLRLLGVTPGVRAAEPVPEAEARALVQPWLGDELLDRLPLPVLIDVWLDPGQPLDLGTLRTRLENAAPGTILDDHDRWVSDARSLAASIAIASVMVLVVVSGATVLAVLFAVRTGVAIHRGEIQILTLIGAPDRYIARQFEGQAARSAVVGGGVGALLAAATLIGIQIVGGDAGFSSLVGAFSPDEGAPGLWRNLWSWSVRVLPDPVDLVVLIVVPLIATGIAILAARVSVHRALARSQ